MRLGLVSESVDVEKITGQEWVLKKKISGEREG